VALDQDVAGELGRYVSLLEDHLVDVRHELGRVRAEIRLENIEAELLAALTPEERAALEDFLQKKNLAELQAQRQLLTVQRDALVKAIELVRARLAAGAPL
jgi:hypothetical protein